MVIRDEMDPTEHPFNGRKYTSKSAFRHVTKAGNGIEVGNDPQRFNTPSKPKPDRVAIRDSLQKARAKAG